ncbi:DUF1275 domain-containing protein [Actinoplanes sp. TBRC 11911]|uniref:DUF1275 family protein n=1 Tax=Actinoplanes sp. TBRC 11911 TaxID=2729386 RepID=UPI00145C84D4|nr:DUF1275 family protein [Actinoplanes sp. TBRC 11911]NMO54639.1 DUF1275 domain-containing protein [Actinoplanes sp. TBRC 11911]
MNDRLVARLLVLLAAAAGCLDALCVARLGGPFASVITGNLVQLGGGIGTLNGRLALSCGVALAGYSLGVAAGAVGLRRSDPGWGRRTGRVLVVELLLVCAVVAGWLVADGRPGSTAAWWLLGVAAASMGVQSVVTLASGLSQASTTYLTGTLTGIIRDLIEEPRRYASSGPGALRLLALLCGATAGAVLLRVAPLWAPVLSAALVAVVLAVVVASGRR